MTVVVTSWGPAGYGQYGARFLSTFLEYWPTEFDLAIYHEGGDWTEPHDSRKIHAFNLFSSSTQAAAFVQRHKNNLYVQGAKQDPRHYWKLKCVQEGYNFRFNAYKFARKIFVLRHASQAFTGRRVLWLDADAYSFKNVQPENVEALLPPGYDIARLYRGRSYHSECGLMFFDCSSKATRDFLKAFAALYEDDSFMRLNEWHDSWVFDHLILERGPKIYDIPYNRLQAPFDSCALGRYMSHLKGPLKEEANVRRPTDARRANPA